ncbi:hypothetical protein [Kingella denitrificans]
MPLLLTVSFSFQHTAARRRLAHSAKTTIRLSCFNTQPPEGGWVSMEIKNDVPDSVSTHSRPKAAGAAAAARQPAVSVSTHSRPKAAGAQPGTWRIDMAVSTHSRPKAAGKKIYTLPSYVVVSTHSRPKAAGINADSMPITNTVVSTHSRPKAAGPIYPAARAT